MNEIFIYEDRRPLMVPLILPSVKALRRMASILLSLLGDEPGFDSLPDRRLMV